VKRGVYLTGVHLVGDLAETNEDSWQVQPRPKGVPEPELTSADWNQDNAPCELARCSGALPPALPVLCLALPGSAVALSMLPRRSVTCQIKVASLPFLNENSNERR